MTSLSAYELERLENMKRNAAVLAALGLADSAAPLIPPKRSAKLSAVKRQLQPRELKVPSRKSSRISALPAPAVYVDTELANGKVTLGGKDAAVAVAQAKSDNGHEVQPSQDDDDPSPASEDDLFDGEREVCCGVCRTIEPKKVAFTHAQLVLDALHLFRQVFELLRVEKNRIARQVDTAAYHVAQNRALMAMVRCAPASTSELLECWGWGEAKVERYGEPLLGVLRPHLESLVAARRARRAARDAAADEVLSADDDDDDSGGGGGGPGGSAATTRWTRKNRSASDAWDAALDAMQLKGKDIRPAAVEAAEAAEAAGRPDERAPVPSSVEDLLPHELPAYEALLHWKRTRAKELGYNDPCIICHNRTLCELVRRRPSTLAQLPRVWGVGPKRVALHGQLMLDALDPFREQLRSALGSRHVPPVSANAAAGTAGGAGGAAEAADAARTKPERSGAPAAAGGWRRSKARRTWHADAGEQLASEAWREQRDALPSGPWSERRRVCAEEGGCEACARYVADGQQFSYAPMSQRVLDVLASPGAYGSHLAAHEAGWRWHASPNHGQSSHAHQWWPPQAAVEVHMGDGAKLPIGTYKALAVLDAMF